MYLRVCLIDNKCCFAVISLVQVAKTSFLLNLKLKNIVELKQ